jgi:ABC-type maltose transport system permease subunit
MKEKEIEFSFNKNSEFFKRKKNKRENFIANAFALIILFSFYSVIDTSLNLNHLTLVKTESQQLKEFQSIEENLKNKNYENVFTSAYLILKTNRYSMNSFQKEYEISNYLVKILNDESSTIKDKERVKSFLSNFEVYDEKYMIYRKEIDNMILKDNNIPFDGEKLIEYNKKIRELNKTDLSCSYLNILCYSINDAEEKKTAKDRENYSPLIEKNLNYIKNYSLPK